LAEQTKLGLLTLPANDGLSSGHGNAGMVVSPRADRLWNYLGCRKEPTRQEWLVIIVAGFKARSRAVATGTFVCPSEGGDRTYEHKEAKKWFTFFWVPIFATSELGDFIECTSCQSTFYPSVLDARTASDIEDITTIAVRHVAVAVLRADGRVDPAEREAAVTVVNRFASHGFTAADIDADVDSFDPEALTDQLEELGAVLNEHGKEAVLTAAVYLAGADGHVDASELEVARKVGRALTMSSAHVQGTIDQELARLNSPE